MHTGIIRGYIKPWSQVRFRFCLLSPILASASNKCTKNRSIRVFGKQGPIIPLLIPHCE